MESFISEIENPIVKKDIIELGEKIAAHKNGQIDDDKFRSLRLARGVYGQRQQGVQMIRIKLPFGKVTVNQLERIADVADKYSTGTLHITTRQDIQIHYVSLDRTPELWSELEKDDVTLREACGNTVRNVTASSIAGIDKEEPFDVAPYADLVFRYFLRKPFGQELGRKIKISFSSNDKDDAYSFIHDFGFIPKIENGVKGFKVLVGGGLGAQPFLAKVAFEFLPVERLLPFIEASVRVFDRYGERNSRHKARMKYIISKLGIEEFLKIVEEESIAVQYQDTDLKIVEQDSEKKFEGEVLTKENYLNSITNFSFKKWVQTNVFEQKQSGYFAVFLKVLIGNFSTDQARKLAKIVSKYGDDDVRFTIDQSILLKYVRPENLEDLYGELKDIGLAAIGYNSVADITACPGTDTCNLGISDSTNVAEFIESVIVDEYPELLLNQEVKIKISGCMNSCGQHGLAQIGFHGSSQKVDRRTLPALQVLLGGGREGNGVGRIAEKVIKVPSKRVLDVIRFLLNDFEEEKFEDESFNSYFDRKTNKYFYDLLKPLTDVTTLKDEDFIDWGHEEQFKTEIGVGECAGVMIDLVGTLIFDAEEKLDSAFQSLADERYADSIYHAYSSGVQTAKALLLEQKVKCNTQIGILNDFDNHKNEKFTFFKESSFSEFILRINKFKASKDFAEKYFVDLKNFIEQAKEFRTK
ncbi:HEPN domain-containing protein [Crocinitomicaceae bacterium]|nr:HEPN domain-containing protein [Crocinitomicaceae bacterium]